MHSDPTTTDPTTAQPATPGLDLDAIVARAAAATPAPWHEEHIGTDTCVSMGDYGWVAAGPCAPEYDMDSMSRPSAPATATCGLPAAECLGRWHPEWHARATGSGPAAPTTYQLPAEPPPDVKHLWDFAGKRWDRRADQWGDDWERADKRDNPHWRGWAWPRLLSEAGPLSTVPPAGTEGERDG